jgi:coenzyme F420-dependent glucose-6-phosphate dehydrogenase
MVQIGFKLCSEERDPAGLIDDARRAEEAGFNFAAISDHFHPWIDAQGQSPFVWTTLGGIAAATEQLTVGTAVTCPTIRIHPAIIAQAAATVGALMPGRFFLGVGTGERLNEHVLGDRWPNAGQRREQLREAVEVIRELWGGELVSHEGAYFEVDTARLYTVPDEPIPIYVAAGGPEAARLAAEIGDGLMSSGPNEDVVRKYGEAGGGGPSLAEMLVCVAEEDEAIRTIQERWPNPGIPGDAPAELPLPSDFEKAAVAVREEDLRSSSVVGLEPEPYLERINEYVRMGFTHVFLHQVGTDQETFLQLAQRELIPAVRDIQTSAA